MTGAPELHETHISWVLLTDEWAIKIPKPVRTDVLDQRTAEARARTCEREIAVNSRFAPDVYLGVADLSVAGRTIEHAVVMRRLPHDRRLSTLVTDGDGDGGDCVDGVARALAGAHEKAGPADADTSRRVASQAALGARWEADLGGLALAATEEREAIETAADLSANYLAGRRPLFDERIAQGHVREGHGDLRADDVFCLDDGPRLLDALAFSDDLRTVDVLADAAFLVMDLERLDRTDLARRFLTTYTQLTGEHHPGSLAHFYVAHRALVRAKVVAATADDAPRDHRLETVTDAVTRMNDHLRRAQVRLVLVGGVPGSGKSTVAARLGDTLGWPVVSTDETRRDLGRTAVDLGSGDAAYDPATVADVYRETLARAEQLLTHGRSVIVDATFADAGHRRAATEVAHRSRAHVDELVCIAPDATCRARIAHRPERSSSEATADVVDIVRRRFATWPSAHQVDTSHPERDSVASALSRLTHHHWPLTPGGL